jgi:type I restriction enzyme, S subunit
MNSPILNTDTRDPVQQLLANLDLWTGTVTDKSGGRGRGAGKTELTGIKKLRELILELAVRGKLVPQNPGDEPASALLKRIEAEKTRLVKDGKIKKPAKLPPVSDDEQPFELPEGWEWVRLDGLSPSYQNGASSRGDKDGKDIIVLRLADIKSWEVSLSDTRTLPISEKSINQYDLTKGDVLVIRVNGSADIVGRFITVRENLDAIYCDHFIRIRFPTAATTSEFFALIGSSNLVRNKIQGLFISTAGQKTINQKHLGSILIPLPPLAEQQRIVERVDQLMALCDQLEQGCLQQLDNHQQLVDTLLAELTATSPSPASDSSTQGLSDSTIAAATTGPDAPEHNSAWQRIHDQFDRLFSGAIQTAFPPLKTKGQTAGQAELVEAQSILVGAGNSDWAIDRLKETILQLAVMGRLVPQNESDEPASALLKRIDAEKARLVKDGKIKKPAKLPPISDDEKPFQLPDGWEWVRFGDICDSRLGKMLDKAKNTGTSKPYLRNTNVQWWHIDLRDIKEMAISDVELNEYRVRAGDLLICEGGEPGRCAIWESSQEMYFQKALHRARPFGKVNSRYIGLNLETSHQQGTLSSLYTGATIKHLTGSSLSKFIFPLPPLAEQQRIVERVDQLFALCDQLKAKQQAASQTRQQLTEALVERVLG